MWSIVKAVSLISFGYLLSYLPYIKKEIFLFHDMNGIIYLILSILMIVVMYILILIPLNYIAENERKLSMKYSSFKQPLASDLLRRRGSF